MIRRILRFLAAAAVAFAAVAVVLYFMGARIVLDGGGTPHVRFVDSAASQARQIEAHRSAQRDAGVPPASGAVSSPAPTAPAPTGALPTAAPATAPAGSVAPAPYWTDYRGPLRDGIYGERPLLTEWPAGGLKPLWKEPVGGGYASFAIAGGRAFTIEQRGDREVVAAYDVRTGREIWTNAWDAAFREFMGGDGPRATPTWSDGLVYALGAVGELRCLDAATGRVIWRTNILDDAGASNLQWGMAASPLIVDDTVVVLPGGTGGKSVMAYDRRTGARAWSALDDRQAYVAPMLATIAGERQLIVFSATRVMGLSPDSGRVRWEYPWTTQADIHAAEPLIIGDTRVFISSGYGVGAAVIEISRTGNEFAVREVWRSTRLKNRFNSSVLHNGYIYGFDESILACVDAATGELKWKGGRYGYGQVVLAGDRLIVLTEAGDLVLVRATPDTHTELSSFKAIDGKTWNVPAIADGILLVRNLREMAAFDVNRR